MCYRPRPDLKRNQAGKPANEDFDRILQRLEAELEAIVGKIGEGLRRNAILEARAFSVLIESEPKV